MKFSAGFLVNLLAATAIAAPRNSRRSGLAERVARREAERSGLPLKLTEASAAQRVAEAEAGIEVTHVTLESSNWAGGILTVCLTHSISLFQMKENLILWRNSLIGNCYSLFT